DLISCAIAAWLPMCRLFVFFFQAEDGIRDATVTGVQTCALPISTYLDQPFNFENIQDTLVRNSQVFTGEKIRVIFDSIDKLATKIPQKDFVKSFTELAGKLKDSGATLIVTVDISELPTDLAGSLTDMADCVADLSKDDSDPTERELKIQILTQESAKIDAETFEIDSTKGLVFV